MRQRALHQRPRARSILLLGMTLAASWFLGSGCGNDRREREAELAAQVDSLRSEIDAFRQEREDIEQRARPVAVHEGQIRELQRMGLSDPLVDIARDLRNHPELIPEELVGEVGGRYGFYDPEGVHLLTTRWVLAAFDDGHRQGHMLLEFTVRESGVIEWKRIAWALDG